jgi:two-component system, chemotaxis family, chemotaxis protein CheY
MLEKVLIVEDSHLQAKMYQTVLGTYPACRLIFALNGLEALDQLALEKNISLIVLDINMPKMNGLAFLEAMRRNGCRNIPVIIVTTEGKDEDIQRGLEAGAKAYIKKPWKPDQLRDLINKVISGG